MSDERQQAEALDAFLSAYQAGKAGTPRTPEAELAADLVDLAASLPMPPEMRQLAETSTKKPDLSLIDPHRLQESKPMIARRTLQTPWYSPLTLVATLLLFLFVGALLLPFANRPTLSPPPALPQHQPRLPIPVGGQMHTLDGAVLNTMRDMGMTWTAFTLDYTPDDHETLLAQAQELIDGAHQGGFRILLTYSGAPDALSAEDAYRAYAEFVGQVAALGADAIQVWGAPNLSVNWQEGEIDPARYVDLLRQSYEAIKAAHADTMVISAAPAPTSAQESFGSDYVWNDDAYYAGMAEAGALQYADCIGVNYYEGALAPTATDGDKRDNIPTRYFVPMLQRAATAFRASGEPFSLCLTEFGYYSHEGLDGSIPDGFAWASDTTVAQQAEWLASGIETAAQLSSIRVEMVVVYRMTVSDEPVENGYAVIRPDGSCLACEAIAALRQ
jgi:hypothetical protein